MVSKGLNTRDTSTFRHLCRSFVSRISIHDCVATRRSARRDARRRRVDGCRHPPSPQFPHRDDNRVALTLFLWFRPGVVGSTKARRLCAAARSFLSFFDAFPLLCSCFPLPSLRELCLANYHFTATISLYPLRPPPLPSLIFSGIPHTTARGYTRGTHAAPT